MKKIIKYLALFSFVICISSILFFGGSIKNQIKNIPAVENLYSWAEKEEEPKVIINDIEIEVDVVTSPADKAKGLGGRKKLGENEGMLFVFEKESMPTFWMKNMNFDIDIIWITDGKIAGIEKSAPAFPKGTPDSQLPKYNPPSPIDYVLEVNAGFCEKKEIKTSNEIDLSNIK